MLRLQKLLRSKADKASAKDSMRFFKTAPGEYGHGDLFLGGWSMPELRILAKSNPLSLKEISTVFKSPFHEERMVAILILLERFSKEKGPKKRKALVNFYLHHRNHINNWDLVDVSTHKILGQWTLENKNPILLKTLVESKRHWDRRLAIVALLAWVKAGELSLTLDLVRSCFKDPEDLMHKACGWVLRELGKKDPKLLKKFLKENIRSIPRTSLRYAIERFQEQERKSFLKL